AQLGTQRRRCRNTDDTDVRCRLALALREFAALITETLDSATFTGVTREIGPTIDRRSPPFSRPVRISEIRRRGSAIQAIDRRTVTQFPWRQWWARLGW